MPAIRSSVRPGNPTAEVDHRPALIGGTVALLLAAGAIALFGGSGNSSSTDVPAPSPAVGAALVDRGPEPGSVSSPRTQVTGAAAVNRGPELGTVGPVSSADAPIGAGSVQSATDLRFDGTPDPSGSRVHPGGR